MAKIDYDTQFVPAYMRSGNRQVRVSAETTVDKGLILPRCDGINQCLFTVILISHMLRLPKKKQPITLSTRSQSHACQLLVGIALAQIFKRTTERRANF